MYEIQETTDNVYKLALHRQNIWYIATRTLNMIVKFNPRIYFIVRNRMELPPDLSSWSSAGVSVEIYFGRY